MKKRYLKIISLVFAITFLITSCVWSNNEEYNEKVKNGFVKNDEKNEEVVEKKVITSLSSKENQPNTSDVDIMPTESEKEQLIKETFEEKEKDDDE